MATSKLSLARDEDILATAEKAGTWAQERAGVTIRELIEIDDLVAISRLLQSIWGGEDEIGPPLKPDLLRALAHAGNYVAGAFDDAGLRGALVGFLGADSDGVHLHSHILGVQPSRHARGTGFALKVHQRAWALAHGHDTVEWTFDPLVRRNAYFNLTKLGGDLHRYHLNFYGAMADTQNGVDDSDRVVLRWNLRSDRVVAAAAGAPSEARFEDNGATHVGLAIGSDGQPIQRQPTGRPSTMCLYLPDNIIELRSARPEQAVAWRLALRESLTSALADGYECEGVTRSGAYVLVRPGAARRS
ncbi:MAG: GNAT family N-acetyltransferase [Candidatus Dormibacteria bacterium]